MADPVDRLLGALTLGDIEQAKFAAFEILCTSPSPARAVTLTRDQVLELANMLDVLGRGKERGRG